MHNPKICRFEHFVLYKSVFLFSQFFKDIQSQFSKANLGYLDKFFVALLKSIFALNNLIDPPGKLRLAKTLVKEGLIYLISYKSATKNDITR